MASRLLKSRKFRSSKGSKDLKEPSSPKTRLRSDSTEIANTLPPPAKTPERSDPQTPPKPSKSHGHVHRQAMTPTTTSPHTSTPPTRNRLHPGLAASSLSPSPSIRSTPGMPSTIRTVSSFEGAHSDTSSDTPSIATKNSAFSTSVNSNTSAVTTAAASHTEDDRKSAVRLKGDQSENHDSSMNGHLPTRFRAGGTEQSQTGSRQQRNHTQADEPLGQPPSPPIITHTPDVADVQDAQEASAPDAQDPHAQWDSTIGKAGLGKTGRVINKLVSDNEALKRDIKIERLKAEEAKQAAKLTEDKMERLVQDYESRLLEANVTKTLLARKERQVESLTASVELERERAAAAVERERKWRNEMEAAKLGAKVKVDEATAHAQLMDGRYNAIASHWRDQGEEVKLAAAELRGEISALVKARREDDEKIVTLRELCDQQDGNIKELVRQKEEIARQFEAYKREQEEWLGDVKGNARAREQEQERLLEETRETLGKLRWALNVKANVRGAQ